MAASRANTRPSGAEKNTVSERHNFITSLAAAREYLSRGWYSIPLEGKRPSVKAWQNARYCNAELDKIFANNSNPGLLLGEASGGLADVDLDCREAQALASILLPATAAKFGRASSPRCHWMYKVSPASFKTERFADPDDAAAGLEDHEGALVELRGDGAQTMAPPSVHPSGERVNWEADFSSIAPAQVALGELRRSVQRLAAASLIARHWNKLPRHDATLALTGALLQNGFSADEATVFVLAVANDEEPDDRGRAVEDTIKKFNAGEPVAGATKCRELFGDRVWSKIAEWLKLRGAGDWDQLDPSVINDCRNPAPELPLEVFGPRWGGSWIPEQAALKSAPPDYVAASLLGVAAGLIGNARAASPWEGWAEPSILWCARVGNPSSGKSPAADAVHSIVHKLEEELADAHFLAIRVWEQARARAKAERAKWESDLKSSLKDGASVGELPTSAFEPDRPRYPHLVTSDTTPEALGWNPGLPKGLTQIRDELGGWLENFGRYGAGKKTGERAFWTEAHGGRPFKIDRVSHKEAPLYIPALSVSIDGGIQPERLANLLLEGDDDGLPARFLYFWPNPVPIERPVAERISNPALDALRKLRDLSMESRRVLRLTEEAAERFQAWRVTNADAGAETSGMFQSWVGKLPGVVLRLALVLKYLRWCSEDTGRQEPENIDLDTTLTLAR
jgi:hypothetical protein